LPRKLSLKDWRKTKGLTQLEVAADLGIHVQYVSAIERGAKRPGMRVAMSIREYTGGLVTLDSLVPARIDKAA